MKFEMGTYVTAEKLLDSHRMKGFVEGDMYKCVQVPKKDRTPVSGWGYWIKSKTGPSIRLQDLAGNLTGHGQFFKPIEPKKIQDNVEEMDFADEEDEE
jgi:hypothetical protein